MMDTNHKVYTSLSCHSFALKKPQVLSALRKSLLLNPMQQKSMTQKQNYETWVSPTPYQDQISWMDNHLIDRFIH